ncbi:MAG: type I polyketide synthase, partial [Cyanobacteria bacterium P01_F01_bin.86]
MAHSRWLDTNEGSPQTPSNYRDLLAEATLQIRKLRNQLDDIEQRKSEPIAIVGMSCRFPGGANTPEAYWELLREGIDAVREIPSQRWSAERYYSADADAPGKMYTRYGSFIDEIDQFDPQFFGISPREAESLDPQQRLLLETSYTALENAGLPPFDLKGTATGVFVGLSFDDYAQRSVRSGDFSRIDAFSSLGNTRSIAAGRIAYAFGFQGPTMQLDTTCSSSLLAVHLACQSLRNGESNLALAGGVNLMLSPEVTVGFCKLKALSKDGRCKTFDASADGYGRGEGCGIVVLKRLSDAVANQDNILALVKGSAVNHDGVSNGLTAPNGSAQTAVIRQALTNAKLESTQVQYVEAHGTGTSLGDPIELLALDRALGADRPSPLIVGSVKTNFGHLEAAAGVAGLMKVILALQHKQIPPHLHLTTPNPYIPWERLAIEIPRQLTPWPTTNEPKRAGLSGFGMSGTNAHLIIEETFNESITDTVSAEQLGTIIDRPLHLLSLSARNEAALRELAQRYQHWLPKTTAALPDICFTANAGRSHFTHRLGIVAANKETLVQQLQAFLAKDIRRASSPVRHKTAFLFTGQGAQYVGMGRQLYETEPVFRNAIDHCADLLSQEGIDLLGVLYPDSKVGESGELEALHQTANTQPAIFALSHALTKLWRGWGIQPDYVLGHSVGEYAAAHAAGIISLEDGLRLVAARGRLMQALPLGGGMVVVMASQEKIASLLPTGVEIAAVNGPDNTVIAGELSELKKVVAQLEAQGLKTKQLRVSHAFHSVWMEPMLDEFQQLAEDIEYSSPDIDIVSSITGKVANAEMTQPQYWVEQIRQSVQFAAAMETLQTEGSTLFIEMGSKPTLLAMGQACLPSLPATWLPSLSSPNSRKPRSDWETLLSSLRKLYEAGGSVDWAGFDRAYLRRTVLLPNYPFQRQRYWLPAAEPSGHNKRVAGGRYHPLLGRSRSFADKNIQCFEVQISSEAPLTWRDHQVFGKALMPAAAYVEMGLAAGEILFESGYSFSSIALHDGLWLDPSAPTQVQTLIKRADQDTYTVEIYSSSSETPEENWIHHLTGTLQNKPAPSDFSIDLDELQQLVREPYAAATLYSQFSHRGIDYGPSFQGIKQAWSRSTTEALASIELPFEPSPEASEFLIHPVLLDAGLQLAGVTLSEKDGSYLPVAIEKFSRYQPMPKGEIWVYAQQRSEEQTTDQTAHKRVVVDVRWLSEQGLVLADMIGLALQKVSKENLLVGSQQQTQWLHKIAWRSQPITQASAEFLLPPDLVCDGVASPTENRPGNLVTKPFSQLIQQPDFLSYQSLQPELNNLTLAYIQQAFLTMGWTGTSTETRTENFAESLGVIPQQHQLFARCVALLTEIDAWALLDPQQICQRLSQNPLLSAELTLLKRCGENLAAVFQGQLDPLTLLFPEGDLTDLTELYQHSIGPQVMNQLVQEAVMTTVAPVPAERPLRILEIGAGTGGTTAHLLPQLAQLPNAL